MATDSNIDNWEFGKKKEAIRYVPHKNGLLLPCTSVEESPPFCGINQTDLDAQSTNKIRDYDFDLASKSSRSGPEFRFINPAIYAESFESDANDSHYVEKSIKRGQIHSHRYEGPSPEPGTESRHGTTVLEDRISILSISNGEDSASTINVDGDHAPATYRCLPSVTSTTTSSSLKSYNHQSKPIKRIERRCKISDDMQASWESRSSDNLCLASIQRDERKNIQRCSLNGLRNIQSSTTSLSTTNLSERQTLNGVSISRQIAHAEWVREKEREVLKIKEEKRHAEQKKKEKEERINREREERERRERESFLRWAERKKKEEISKREAVERELELQKRLKEVEDKAGVAKTIYLRQWVRKKEEEQKVQQRKQQLKQQQEDEEKKKRLEESVKAYEKWREKSKDKPKPATQGLLPHQKAKPAFVNPNPWQQIIEDGEESDEPKEIPKDPAEKRKTPKFDNDKNKGRKSKSSHQ